MSYEMSVLRKEDLSLYLYLKDTVLKNFQESVEYAPLTLVQNLCGVDSFVYAHIHDIEPSPTERGRGWLYFDTPNISSPCEPFPSVSGINGDGLSAYGTPEQSSKVILYETTYSGLQVVDWKDYMIDYVDGRIITNRQLTDPKVSYTWNYVSVVDEWSAVEAANTPVIVIDVNSTNKSGYQLGGGKKSNRRVDIHIFASNTAERNDLSEVIYDGLYNKSCPLYDFRSGAVIDYDGTFYGRKHLLDRDPDPTDKTSFLFDRHILQGINTLYFDSVVSRNVSLPLVMSTSREGVMLSDLNAYRSRINFNMYSYDNRGIYQEVTTPPVTPEVPVDPPATTVNMSADIPEASTTVTILMGVSDSNEVMVDWGDGVSAAYSGSLTMAEHTYSEPGLYDVVISGDLGEVNILGLQNQPYVVFDWDIDLLTNIKLVTVYNSPNAVLDLSTISNVSTLLGLMLMGQDSVVGNLSDIPESVYMLQASNTIISGQLSDLTGYTFESNGWLEAAFGMTGPSINITASPVTGNISDIYNVNLKSIILSNLNLTYIGGLVPESYSDGEYRFTNCGLDRFEVGQVIIDFDSSVPYGSNGTIDLRNNGVVLDDQVDVFASYNSLISKGFNVYIQG